MVFWTDVLSCFGFGFEDEHIPFYECTPTPNTWWVIGSHEEMTVSVLSVVKVATHLSDCRWDNLPRDKSRLYYTSKSHSSIDRTPNYIHSSLNWYACRQIQNQIISLIFSISILFNFIHTYNTIFRFRFFHSHQQIFPSWEILFIFIEKFNQI